jgi:hypothetical protein
MNVSGTERKDYKRPKTTTCRLLFSSASLASGPCLAHASALDVRRNLVLLCCDSRPSNLARLAVARDYPST